MTFEIEFRYDLATTPADIAFFTPDVKAILKRAADYWANILAAEDFPVVTAKESAQSPNRIFKVTDPHGAFSTTKNPTNLTLNFFSNASACSLVSPRKRA